MQRIIDKTLLEWKNSARRKPLIVRGARQVGKTYSVKQFGTAHFGGDMVVVDLERNPNYHRVFVQDLDPARLLAEFELLTGARIVPGKTLLFLDEIQSCPRAIMALRYLYEERPELHVIAAGSLLEFAMKDLQFPVGRAQFASLCPMTFAEYLQAIGRSDLARLVLGRPALQGEAVHALLMEELRRYFFVGGMPESVAAYRETRSLQESFAVQSELCDAYRQDFAKYAPRADKQCLSAVLLSVAQGVGGQTKYSGLAEGYTNPTVKKAYDLLCLAHVIRKVSAASPAGLPLGASASPRKFKSLMVDIGLMQQLCGLRVDAEYAQPDLLAVYRGALAEQFVGQELAVSQGGEVYYWARHAAGSSAEVDYLAAVDGAVVPIEVKSGAPGRFRSMKIVLEQYRNCPYGLVFSGAPYSESYEAQLRFLPLYYAYSATGGHVFGPADGAAEG